MNTKRIITIAALMFIGVSVFSQKGVINNGAKIVIESNAVLRISGGTNADYTNQSDGTNHGSIDLDGKIILEGDWFNNATGGNVFIDTDGEVKFAGASTQTIGGTRATYFEKLTLDNSNGISLGNDITVFGNLWLTNGNIVLGSDNLTLGTYSNIIGTPSASKMIVASGTGELRKMFSATGSFTYPVGDNSGTIEYTPATLDFTSGTFGSSAYAGINITDSKHTNNTSTTDFLSRYWKVNQNNISGFSCDVTFTYKDADINGTEGSIYSGQWEDPNWIKLNLVNTGSNLVKGTVSTFSDFTGGENSVFSIAMSMADDGSIPEAAENGEVITVNIQNDIFADPLTPSNWTVTNLPSGVTKGDVNRVNDTQATITLSGNRSVDYDSDITDVMVEIDAAELELSISNLVASTGVTLTATVDAESITISDDGITEGSENGEDITVALTGGTFVSSLNSGNWTLSNLPGGVTKGTITRDNTTQATITLNGNRTSDYDTDITDLTVSITADEIDDHTGVDISTSAGVTFVAVVESAVIDTTTAALSESNLDGSVIQFGLVNETFADDILDKANFSLNYAPPGTSIYAVNYVDPDSATITLAFDGTDFDIDYNFSVTVSPDELSGVGDVTSNTLIITFVDEPAKVYLHHAGLTELNLDGAIIGLGLRAETFVDGTLDKANFTLTNPPEGTTINDVTWLGVDTASVTLAFDGTDFDDNITNFYMFVDGSEVTGGTGIASYSILITATNDVETISMADDGEIIEGSENGEVITVTLTGGTFVDPLTTGNWTLTNLPDGVTRGAVVRTDATHATITLSGDRTTDYDSDITNLTLSISTDEINDTTGSAITTNTGVTFIAIDEPGVVTISHAGLTEENIDAAVIDITLFDVQFVDATLDPANFTLNYAPTGTSIGSVSYTDSVTATVTLSYDGSDFDTQITNFSITINADELSGGVALTSNTLTITATVESESVAISHDGLNGDNLNGAEIAIELTNVSFADTILDKANFTLNNMPSGTSIDTVVYTDVTHANLTLAYDGTVFNDSIYDFNITVSSSELTGLDDLVSNDLVISPATGIGPYPEALDINIYSYEDRIFIKCSDPEKLKEVAVYNILGRQLIRRKLDKSPLNEIIVTEPSSYYVVRVFTDEGITIRKVFISGR